MLVIDDEEPLVRLVEEWLAELGYEPIGFTRSRDALDELRANLLRFDAVVVDESMPGLTGTCVAGEIHRLRPDVPILLVSGFSGPELAGRARSAGITGLLRKPLRRRELALALARALQLQEA